MAIAFPLLLLVAGVIALYRACHGMRALQWIVLLALASRLLFAGLNVLGVRFPYSDTTDINAFMAYAEGVGAPGFAFDASSSYVWAAIIGVINLYTGDMTFSPLVINVLAGCYVVILGYRIADLLFSNVRRAVRIAAVLAITPPLVFMSATFLRDAATTLCVTAFAYHLLHFGLQANPRLSSVLAILIWGALAALFHGAFVALPGIALIYMVLRSLRDRVTGRSLVVYAVTMLAVLGVVLAYSYFGVGASKVGALYGDSGDLVRQRILATVASGMMAEHTDVLAHAPWLFIPIAVLKFLFSPFFADQLRAFDIVRLPMTVLLFVALLNVLMRSLPVPFGRLRVSFSIILCMLLGYCLLFAVGSLDPDTAFRHYIKFMPLLIAAGLPVGAPQRLAARPFDGAIFRERPAR